MSRRSVCRLSASLIGLSLQHVYRNRQGVLASYPTDYPGYTTGSRTNTPSLRCLSDLLQPKLALLSYDESKRPQNKGVGSYV